MFVCFEWGESKMTCEAEARVKEKLISNAIHLVAKGGFEKATTKELTFSGGDPDCCKMNEVYIYRYFGSKEELFAAAFVQLDDELYGDFRRAVEIIGGFEDCTVEKLHRFFTMTWEALLESEEKFRYYVRYYYSVYFKSDSLKSHEKHFERMADNMKVLFKEEANVNAIIHSAFTSLLDFAVLVYNGQLEDGDINRPHVFNVVYSIMAAYFREPAKLYAHAFA